jgi:hypothetical protein
MNRRVVVAGVALVLVVLLIFGASVMTARECAAAGKVAVRGLIWWECVAR